METRAAVEEVREPVLKNMKERNANVFTFNWARDSNPKGLERSQPTLLYRGSEQPLYGLKESRAKALRLNEPAQKSTPETPAKKPPSKN